MLHIFTTPSTPLHAILDPRPENRVFATAAVWLQSVSCATVSNFCEASLSVFGAVNPGDPGVGAGVNRVLCGVVGVVGGEIVGIGEVVGVEMVGVGEFPRVGFAVGGDESEPGALAFKELRGGGERVASVEVSTLLSLSESGGCFVGV